LGKSRNQTLQSGKSRRFRLRKRWLILLLWPLTTWIVSVIVPPPVAVAQLGKRASASNVQFLVDDSYLDAAGERVLEQQIFDQVFNSIRQASTLIVLDMFLFNDWQGPVRETHRLLSGELTATLIAKRATDPTITIIVVTDPINTVYRGLPSRHLDALKAANIDVVMTDLTQMQDSNPVWSSIWRWLIRPFGNESGNLLPNPFGDGRVSLRSYLALLNFKANHRKLLITDNAAGELTGLVSSANPHDGSSAHRNIALSFNGPAVRDLLSGERLLLEMSGAHDVLARLDKRISELNTESVSVVSDGHADIQVISESQIRDSALAAIDKTTSGDSIDMAMFYLSHRKIVRAMAAAASRGVDVRVLLDVNQDAFGRQKNGVPNRPVAAELQAAGAQIRWCKTLGEQCHAKWLHTATRIGDGSEEAREHQFFIGSANFTRRNLDDFNLETDIVLFLDSQHPLTLEMTTFFERQWENQEGRVYSADYDEYADDSLRLRLQYRFMEATGLSTF